MAARNLIAVKEQLEGVGFYGAIVAVGDLHRYSGLEIDLNGLRLIWSVLWTDGHFEHGIVRATHGVLEHPGFVRGMIKILVDTVVCLGLCVDRDAVLGAVVEQVGSSLERFDEFGVSPRGNAGGLGHERLHTHLKPDLVVALARGAVSDVGGPVLPGDADHLLGNARPGDRGAQQVTRFVDCVAFDGLKDVVLHKILTEIRHDALDGTACDCLRLDGFEIFVMLANIGTEGNHVKSLLTQPREDDRRIKAARVGEDELGLFFRHGLFK
mmetsp:Transcript_48576/g.90146  ORF Transcript_48576/g.90146 Transcript_48576/m.90146 type:complete len:268 (+) Transcript_48576:578-1381(+)